MVLKAINLGISRYMMTQGVSSWNMSTLEVLSFFFLLVIFLQQTSATKENECKSLTSCGDTVSKIPIRFPLRLKGLQHKYCGYPGFELSCTKKKETVLELPFSGKFFVRSIDYVNQEIDLYYPAGCLVGRLLHFSLSNSPFNVRYGRNYTFFNCSKDFKDDLFTTINCLSISNSGYTVRYINGDHKIGFFSPEYCNFLKTASIPWKIFETDEDNNLTLAWDKPGCGKKCESQGQQCGFKSNYTGLDNISCSGNRRSHKGTWKKKAAIGVSIGFIVSLVATVAVIRTCTQTDKGEKEKHFKIEKFLENYKDLRPTRYSYADIKRMTKKFKRKLGKGGYGSVYKGKLTNGIPVAVKILNNSQSNGEEFINEVGTIGRIHHINVVRLLGFCADGFRRALIYEFMQNGSLEKYIFSSGKYKNPFFCWEKLQEISISIARGIEYLHQGCDQRILHFDIKPHNILLDHKFNPKISDFGLAKLCSKEDSMVSMTAARGTMGYIAPEVFSRNFGNVSSKSDVYSFGMLLLEMVGGRKNIEVKVDKPSQVYFPDWIYSRLEQGKELGIEVQTEEDAKIARKLATVALWCIQWNPVNRPSIKSVTQMLEGNNGNLITPPYPFASTASATTSATIPGKPQQQIELTVIQEQPE